MRAVQPARPSPQPSPEWRGSVATGLDHVALIGTDGPALHAAFEQLGFLLTPLARQSGRLHADGPVEAWGTANRCAMLRRGYIELQAIIDPALPANGLDQLLARYQGMHNITLAMDDEEANLDRLRRAGVAVTGVLHLERAVDDADPASPRARFARLPLPDSPEGRVQLVRHLTPEAIWQDRFTTHPNRAVALEAAILVVREPAETAARFSRLAGRPVTPDPAGGFVLDLGAGSVRILPPEALAAVLPGVAPPTLPFMAGLVVRTDDGAAAVCRLAPHFSPVPDGLMIAAGGAAIVFC